MKLRSLLAFCVLASAVSHAFSASGWQRAGKVTRIHSGHHAGEILFSTHVQHAAGCTSDSHGYWVTNDAESTRRIYSLLVLAHATGKDVSIHLTGACVNGRPRVDAVQINDVDYF
jgi:hypothetical protein